MADADRAQNGQIDVEEAREEAAFDDEADIGGTSLLAVLEALAQLLGELVPLGELPDAVGVDALHLEHVAARLVVEVGGDNTAVGLAAHEREAGDLGMAHQGLAQM